MGSNSSKFRKALQTGDEKTAEEIYNHSQDFQKAFDPNVSYGENNDHNTALHYACRHGMHRLVRIFLQKHSGNPIKRNNSNQTSLHCVCMSEVPRPPSSTYSYSQYYYSQPPEKKRAECLRLILAWEGIRIGNGEREKIDINAADEDGCTALHYAAAAGYRSLVETLLEKGACLFVENGDKETPCDCAERNRYYDIAQLLESKMVFSQISEEEVVEDLSAITYEESYVGLKPQDLQEAKDALVVETADMLRVPLFTAEALLRNYEWSREVLLEEWITNPIECCDKSGVKPPEDLDSFVAEHTLTTIDSVPESPGLKEERTDEHECDICTETIPHTDVPVDIPCSHQFCRDCWERYLSGKIIEGNAHNIMCPAFECCKLVPVEIIETLVSREMARRFLQFDIKAFVETNPSLKWCPKVGCGRAVRLPPAAEPMSPQEVSSPTAPPPMSKAVDCGSGHLFCWDCCGEPHDPCSCENWKKWMEKITEIQPEKLNKTEEDTEIAANCLWLVTNSKPCPKCHSPIQKNEGCNHMKCTKCKHDFCWVCLEVWSKHSSETGGYFRCNRYEIVQKVEEKAESLTSEAEKRNREMQELNRFLHYYTRFRNHENSYNLEEPLLRKAPAKMRKLACHSESKASKEDTQFIIEAIHELLAARHILKFSYPYGYYLEDRGGSKQIFEFMQNELEESAENLSQMVARNYLRTPRVKIIQAAQLAKRKRYEFLSAVSKGFLPPDVSSESPPRRRTSSSWSYQTWDEESDGENDEALRRAIEASIQDAMAQSQKQETEEEDFLPMDLSRGRPGSGRSQGGSGSSTMTAGLLRALEMSQLLLMQQTEMLNTPSSRLEQPSSSNNTEQQSVAEESNPSTSSQSVTRPSPNRGKSPRRKDPSLPSSDTTTGRSNFDDDFKRAVELSLRDVPKLAKDRPGTSLRQRRVHKSSSSNSSAMSVNMDFHQLFEDIAMEKSTRIGSKAHSKSKSGRHTKTDKTKITGAVGAGTSELSRELESEFDRIRNETLATLSLNTSNSENTSLPVPKVQHSRNAHRTGSPLRTGATGGAGLKSDSPSMNNALKLDQSAVRKKSSKTHGANSGKGVRPMRTGRASSDPHTVAIDKTLKQIQARESSLSSSAQDVTKSNQGMSEDSSPNVSSVYLKTASAGNSPAGGSPAARPKIKSDQSSSPLFTIVQKKNHSSLSPHHTPLKKSSLGDITFSERPHSAKPRKASEGDVAKLILMSARNLSTMVQPSVKETKPSEDIWKKATIDEIGPSPSSLKLTVATNPPPEIPDVSVSPGPGSSHGSALDLENGNMVHISSQPVTTVASAYPLVSEDSDQTTPSVEEDVTPSSDMAMPSILSDHGNQAEDANEKNDVWQVYI